MQLTACVSVWLVLIVMVWMAAPAMGQAQGAPEVRVYHLGNSLTRNLPLQRLAKIVEMAGGKYDYGMQLGGGHRLEQHLVMRNHDNAPGEGKYNTREPYGTYDNAFKNFRFDAVVLQPHRDELDKPHELTPEWPYHDSGDLQAASALIDYARGKTQPGTDRWDLENANSMHGAAEDFFIYATWPDAGEAVKAGGFSEYWKKPYEGGVQASGDYFEKLVDRLNELHADLPRPVRMIPAGHVMAALDMKIRSSELPGIEAFYERNQAYFRKSRRSRQSPSPFDPDRFEASGGVLNFYADGIHMNDIPHDGRESGAIGSYVAALTMYATVTGRSPIGMPAQPYEQFDAEADAELIRVLQETVWSVVQAQSGR